MRHRDTADFSGSAALGAWAAFTVVALVAAGGHGAPLGVDQTLLSWSVGHRPEVVVAVARGLTATGTGVVPYVLVALAGTLLGRTARQRTAAAAVGVFCLAVGQAARQGVMELVARPRPPHQDWATHASGWSFPSGHTTTSAVTAGLVILAILLRAPRGRTALCLAVGCWGALVGLTRVYLGVHWFTDVVGGWLFAVGWLGVCLCAAVRWLPPRFVDALTTRATGRAEAAAVPQEPSGGAGRSHAA
ncbi:phosphatase PAP2 family protein [Streptomyces sp. NPDC021356]|uniref:phosphatase PAP2 family protein n=1 Tax=Streptomyces sp. NPDC021356 TaxID=3154900 RepID=UPI0033F51B1C